MAFTIIRTDNQKITWHIPNKKPQVSDGQIRELHADGDELDQINTGFKNLPIKYGHTIWKGDMAQFIYDNMF